MDSSIYFCIVLKYWSAISMNCPVYVVIVNALGQHKPTKLVEVDFLYDFSLSVLWCSTLCGDEYRKLFHKGRVRSWRIVTYFTC